MHQLKIKRLLAAVSLALMPLLIVPQMSFAAGLGKLRVNSGLGEPLSAEIDVLSATNAELDSLEAKIASDSVYESQGIDRPSLYNAIRVEVKKKNGGAVLKLSSAEAITEPFLDMLIQMDWGSGQLLREYNLLLDPPGYNKAPTINLSKEESPTAKSEGSALPAAEDDHQPIKKSNKKSAKKIEKVKTKLDQSAGEATHQVQGESAQKTESNQGNAKDYTTKAGDSLSNIAKKSLQDGVSLDQYMVAMFRANQDAFQRQNMNRLKVGQIVKAPSVDEAMAVPLAEARKEVVLHSKDWNGYKNNLADQVEKSAGQDEASPVENQSKGKISAKAEDKSTTSTEPRDVVKLSKSDNKATNASKTQLNALQDELSARDNAIKEANIKAAMLEKRISDMEKLLTLKNHGLAEAQKNATTYQEPTKPSEDTKNVEAKPDVEPPKTEASKSTEGAAPNEPHYSEVVTPSPKPVTSSESKPTEAVKSPEPKTNEEATAPSMFDGLLSDPIMLGGAAGGLALLGGAWLFVRNKRKRGLDSLEKAIQTTSGLKENTVFGNTEGASIGSGTTSFLTDFSQSGGGMIDTHDVDPIAEAEVYMAYGRDAQAEEILKDAIAKDPKRAELHLKLLELYAGRKDTQSFETVAGELYSTLGAEDPLWAKASALGRTLDPNNPLYQAGESETIPSSLQGAGTDFADALSDSSLAETEHAVSEEVQYHLGEDVTDDAMSIAEMDADFAAIEGFDLAEKASPELEFSLEQNDDEFNSLADKPLPEVAVGAQSQTADNGLDFPALDQGLGEQVLDQESSENALAGVESNEIAFPDFSGFEVSEVDDPKLPESELQATENSSYPVEEIDKTDDDQLANLATKTQEKLEEINLDLPDIDADGFSEIDALADSVSLANGVKEIDLTQEALALDLPNIDLPSIDLPETELSDTLSDDTEDALAMTTQEESLNKVSASEMDFSKIDLDLGVESAVVTSEMEIDGLADAFDMEAESSEVETKLDLVTAYIDMGDQEGAKELLDEVLKEGGPQQRIRAQDMLKSLT